MLLALIFTGVQLNKEKKENKRQYELFLNRFYIAVERPITLIDYVLEEAPEERELERSLLRIEHELEKADELLDAGCTFASLDIGYTQIFTRHPIVQFADGDELTNEEKQYLKDLKEDLQSIRIGMYSDETEQENPNISPYAFKEILRGSNLHSGKSYSGFLTENRSVPVHFEMIGVEQSPVHIQKWLEKNATEKQKKIFLVEGKTYVVIVLNSEKIGIKNMYRTGETINVNHVSQTQNGESNQQSVAIAQIDMEINRSFQFSTPIEENVEEEDVESNEKSATLHDVSGSATVELIPPEKLSKDGEVVND